jgi:diphthamide synthase (EF-2-diphthine--ammonia ligase)
MELIQTFIGLGFKAYLCCVDSKKLDRSFSGRSIDADLISHLPAGVDPCGENGEYHSYVYDGPIFSKPIGVTIGEIVLRDVRYFADLLAVDPRSTHPLRTVTTYASNNPDLNPTNEMKGETRC